MKKIEEAKSRAPSPTAPIAPPVIPTPHRSGLSMSAELLSEEETFSGLNPMRARRRSNLIGLPQPQERLPGAQYLYTPYQIPPEQKLRALTFRSYEWFKTEVYNPFLRTNPNPLCKMIDFFETDLQKKIVLHHQAHDTQIGKIYKVTNILEIDDDVLEIAVAEYLRPLDVKDYYKKLWSNITEIEKKLPKNYVFQVKDYDKTMFPVVSRILDEIVTFTELFVLGATPEQLARMPQSGFGSDSEQQKSINYFLMCFRGYAENFRTKIGKDSLKAMKTTNEFIDEMRKINLEFTRLAQSLRVAESSVEPAKNLKEVLQQEDQQELARKQKAEERMQQKFRDGRSLKSLERTTTFEPTVTHDDEDDYTQQLFYTAPQRTVATPVAKDKVEQRVCYEYADTGQCKAGASCLYSHDRLKCESHIAWKHKTAVNSPFFKATVISSKTAPTLHVLSDAAYEDALPPDEEPGDSRSYPNSAVTLAAERDV
jgi:hypothetical protein